MAICSLFLSDEEVQRARQRVSEAKWQPAAEAFQASADALMSRDTVLPKCDYAWYDAEPDRDYSETYGPLHEYTDPVLQLTKAMHVLLHAGLAFGRDDYMQRALEWGDHIMDRFGFHVRHHDAGLCYGWMMPGLVEAYMLGRDRRDDKLDQRWREQLTTAAETICWNREHWATELAYMPYNNHLAHHQRGMLAIGIALDRSDWIDLALNGRGSFAYILPGCTMDDGLCYESSTVYHFGTLGALLDTAEIVRHHPRLGRDLYNEVYANGASIKQMFDAPMGFMLPNGELPPVGDCYSSRNKLWDRKPQYETAYAVYGDERYAWLLQRAGVRDSAQALLLGADELTPVKAPQVKSRLWIEHGYAMLTSRSGDAYWDENEADSHVVALLAGDMSGIHHHWDSMSLQVAAAGRVWVEDVEIEALHTNMFSDPIQTLFNRTVWAHNTVVVDQQDQQMIDYPLAITGFKDFNACRTVTMTDRHERIYEGVRMVRNVAVTDEYCLDVYQVASDTERTYDWLTHPRADGPARIDLDMQPFDLTGVKSYEVLSDVTACDTDERGATMLWSQDGREFRVDVSAGLAGKLIRACWPAVADGSGEKREMFFYRVNADRAKFAALYQVDRADATWHVERCERIFNGLDHEIHVTVTNGEAVREHRFVAVE